MKFFLRTGCLFALLAGCILCFGISAQAKAGGTIKKGIYAGEIDLSGMTAEEATQAVQGFVDGLRGVEITLLAAGNREVVVTADQLGIEWENPELVQEAMEVGTHGNVIKRYKVMKDLEHKNLIYKIKLSFDLQTISDFLTYNCSRYDIAAVDWSLVRENGEFRIVEGAVGYAVDVETSIDNVYEYLTGEWDYKPCRIALNVTEQEPRGSVEELSKVKDVLGSFTTTYSVSVLGRKANVENGCELMDGTLLYPGDEFSAHKAAAPFTEQNGYYMAGSYINGRVVDSVGGGICQVSTTLYNAVLRAELEVKKRYNHSMTVSYVDVSADAALAESSGKDFIFVNSSEYPIYIEGIAKDKKLTFNIYGMESRPSNREVRYESEVLEVTEPSEDQIFTDADLPLGYIVVESAYTGYKARLWKIVLVDGEEVSRTQVNSSSYKMVPRSATVGTATTDENAYNEIMAAVGTSNIDHVKSVIAALAAPPAQEAPEYEEDD